MWIFTNRVVNAAATDPSAFGAAFQPGAEALGVADVQRAGGGFALSQVRADVSDNDMLQLLVPLFSGAKPLLVYLHGNANPPAHCFERCARLQEIYSGVEVVGFSWPSEGFLSSGAEQPNMPAGAAVTADNEESLAQVRSHNRKEDWATRTMRRYRQAKLNAQDSSDALARFLRLLATARLFTNHQPMSIGAHSLGSHFMQYAIETESAAEALGAAHNIALLAACCRADGHAGWVGKLNPKGQVFVTFNKADNVLFGAYIADGRQLKLGAEPGPPLISPKVRYVSFTNAQLDLGGHSYFVRDAGSQMPKAAKEVFRRMFSSERDVRVEQGEAPNKVYPMGCDPDGATCYMAIPEHEVSGPS